MVAVKNASFALFVICFLLPMVCLQTEAVGRDPVQVTFRNLWSEADQVGA
jgi:hypothetical protein